MSVKLSIITAVFNGEETIRDTIQSVLNCGLEDFEHIIVDGASSDGTMKVVEAHKHERMRVLSEPDKGVYDAMNKGIALAKGEWIATLNADDYYAPGALISMFNEIAADVDVLYADLVYINDWGDDRVAPALSKKDYSIFDMPTHHPATFIRKEIYEKFGLYRTDFKIVSDFYFMHQLVNCDCNFKYVNKVVTYMRLGGISTELWKLRHRETSLLYKKLDFPLLKRLRYFYQCKVALLRHKAKGAMVKFLNLNKKN